MTSVTGGHDDPVLPVYNAHPGHPELTGVHDHRAKTTKKVVRFTGVNYHLIDLADGCIQAAGFLKLFLLRLAFAEE